MMSSDSFQPLQLKGEIMDLEFTIDTDHRKRRRNRTTQSCLSCHTSKRKCDRKRPCQRCIQLGLTGLCVYEIDDLALRDDPSVDENTRLRNRIAELESLVRELRGKPHPRWAESSFRDGDPSEKWHSRATKYASTVKRRSPEIADSQVSQHRDGRGVISSLLTPIKTEASSETAPSQLYRFSPSPAPSMRYHTFHANVRTSPASSFEREQRQSYSAPTPSTLPNHSSSSASHASFNGRHPHSAGSSYSDGGSGGPGGYEFSGSDDGGVYGDHFQQTSSPQPFCSCRSSPATAHAYISLSQHLHSTVDVLRQYSQHFPNSQCTLYRRIVELNDLMQCNDPADAAGTPYDGLSNTPTDTEILTPLSASSGQAPFPNGSSGGVSPQEWNALTAAGYNSYFPLPPSDHGLYPHIT